MALIALPTGGLRQVDWTLPDYATFRVASGWTAKQTIGDLGTLRAGWQAKVTVTPMRAADLVAWRGFFATARGVANTFALGLTETAQCATASCAFDGAPTPGATHAQLRGLPLNATVLKAGAIVTALYRLNLGGDFFGQALILTTDLVSDGAGHANPSFDRQLAYPYLDGYVVVLDRPTVPMRLANPKPGWSVVPGRIYTPFAFDCEEAL